MKGIRDHIKGIWQSTLATIGVIGTAFSIYAYFVAADAKIDAYWVVLLISAFALLLVWLVPVLRFAETKYESPLPRVVSLQTVLGKRVLFIDGATRFNVDAFVSIFVLQDRFEVLVGVGCVANVQENGLVVVAIEWVSPSSEETLGVLSNNPNAIRDRIIVKSTVNRAHIAAYLEGEQNG